MGNSDANLHKDHRKRVRDRYLKNGIENFDDHVVLEMLLFYTIPRRDTNPIAHRLINKFGSISGVFSASYDELLSVKGIGPSSAGFICAFADSMRYISLDEMADTPLNTVYRMGEYMRRWFSGRSSGCSAALLLDKNFHALKIFCLTEEHGIGTESFTEKIIGEAQAENSKIVVIAHNHPNGKPESSPDDRRSTEIIYSECKKSGICLAEHFIICGFDSIPILKESVSENEIGDMIKIYKSE